MLGKANRNLSPREKRFFYLGVFTVALLVGSILPPSTLARTWYIKADGTGDAPTIQAGVDSAAVGDTVMVGPGTFTDTTHVMVAGVLRAVNVHIQKQMTLIGDPAGERPLIDGVNSYLGIFIENVGSTVPIAHLSLRGTAFPTLSDKGLPAGSAYIAREYPAKIRCHSSLVEIEDVEISQDHDGVFLLNSFAQIHGNELHAVSMALLPHEGSDATIYNNYIFDSAIGIWCDRSVAHVSNNRIGAPEPEGLSTGIMCSSATQVVIEANTIEWCGGNGVASIGSTVTIEGNRFAHHNNNGVYVSNSSAILKNNVFYQGLFAIYATSGTTGEISNNTMDAFSTGILSELGCNQVISRNIISRGDWGIQCVGSTLTVQCNDIFDMSQGVYYWGCPGQPGEGEFSADPEYCGVDDSGNYFLQSDSPCVPGNHPFGYECGSMGALPVNCGIVEVKQSTWGSIKSSYKDGGER